MSHVRVLTDSPRSHRINGSAFLPNVSGSSSVVFLCMIGKLFFAGVVIVQQNLQKAYLESVFLNPMRTTCQLVKWYTPSYIEPIRNRVRKPVVLRRLICIYLYSHRHIQVAQKVKFSNIKQEKRSNEEQM